MDIKVLINENEIQEKISLIAKRIQEDFKNEELVFVIILKGSVFFSADLAKKIKNHVVMEFIQVSSYEGTQSKGEISLKLDLNYNIAGKNVIIIEDIVDTGRTLTYLKNYLNTKKPKSLKICTLLDKPERREFELEADYVGFKIPNKFVVGYGLDYDEYYRNLPYIGYIEQ